MDLIAAGVLVLALAAGATVHVTRGMNTPLRRRRSNPPERSSTRLPCPQPLSQHAAQASGHPPLRLARVLLVAGGAVYFLAEFIAAAAWTDPPYSYSYHYISNLGVRGPLKALGQQMNSPLAWVMNTGFFLHGILFFVGVAQLEGLYGWRHLTALLLGGLVAIGGVLLANNPGTGEEPPDGEIDYHGLGAMASIVCGNVLVLFLGLQHKLIGGEHGEVMVMLGAFGLVSLIAFLAVAGSETNVLIGFVERCAVYPIMIGFIHAGIQ